MFLQAYSSPSAPLCPNSTEESVLLERLTVPRLFHKLPAFYGTRKFFPVNYIIRPTRCTFFVYFTLQMSSSCFEALFTVYAGIGIYHASMVSSC